MLVVRIQTMPEPLISLRPHFQLVDGLVIHSLSMSSANTELAPIVLLHGLGASAHSYVPLMRALARYSPKLLAPDMPAHGLSPYPRKSLKLMQAYLAMAKALRQKIDPGKPVIVVGNSLGGAFAIHFALDFPELVKGLFLISPAGAPFVKPISETLDRFKPNNNKDSRQIIHEVMGPNTPLAKPLAPLLTVFLRQQAMQSLIDSISNDDCFSPSEIAQLQCPIYMLWGQNDRVLPADQCDYYEKHMSKDTIFDKPKDWGHCPQFIYPGDVAEKLRNFFTQNKR
ncbi:MAG: alpha/beta hydrolase [Bradymonadales bacterium]